MKAIKFFLPIFFAVIFFSCSKDNPVDPTDPGSGGTAGSFTGAWTVDQIQMLQAPVGSGPSALMKQALQVYGSVSASTVGYADITFGQNPWVKNSNTYEAYNSRVKGNTIVSSTGYQLYVSTDGFLSVSEITLPVINAYIDCLSLVDENTIFICQQDFTDHLMLYKSVNKGATWTLVNPNIINDESYGRLQFVNSSTGYFIGYGKFYKTTDGGLSWTLLSVQTNYFNLEFFDENNGVLYENSDNKFKVTVNGGNTWTEHTYNGSSDLSGAFYLDVNNMWFLERDDVMQVKKLYKTNNSGASWTRVNESLSIDISDIYFVNSGEGYCSSGEFILKTTDGGATWTVQSMGHNSSDFSYLVNYNNKPIAFYYNYTMRPGTISDSTSWVLQGKVTNPIYKSVTKAPNYETYATGKVVRDGNNVIFTVYNYSGPGADEKIGSGTFSFDSGFLNISLQFPNEERWKIKLRRK